MRRQPLSVFLVAYMTSRHSLATESMVIRYNLYNSMAISCDAMAAPGAVRHCRLIKSPAALLGGETNDGHTSPCRDVSPIDAGFSVAQSSRA